MYKAVLFDLDGTLLPVDTETFLHKYFQLIGKHVSQLYDPEEFVKHIFAGSKLMIEEYDEEKTNQEQFHEYFSSKINLPEDKIEEFFNDFYNYKFPQLENCVGSAGELPRQIITSLLDSGYRVAIATNSVFPKEAIYHRMKWVGIEDLDVDLITTYENMTTAKPNILYYQEIALKLDVDPSECLMVGNDTKEDLACKKLGMSFFLVTDYVIDREDGYREEFSPDSQGGLEELSDFLTEKLELND